MPLNDGAVLIPGAGRVYLAGPGQTPPTDPRDPADPWSIVGHTSREEGLTITRDAGDSEVKGCPAPGLMETSNTRRIHSYGGTT